MEGKRKSGAGGGSRTHARVAPDLILRPASVISYLDNLSLSNQNQDSEYKEP